MKLFIAATACLAGTKAQSGDYVDREITSDYYNAYSDYDEFGNKKKKQKDNWFGAKFTTTATTGATDWAVALNCWPSNIEADTLVASNQRDETTTSTNPNINPTQRFNAYAPQHVFGSQEVTYRAHLGGALLGVGESTLHQEDPVLRSGLGGQYVYGHDTSGVTHNPNLGPSDSARGIQWYHYKQARHAGCLYEKSDWHYGHSTFDQVYLASYFQGYGSFNRNGGTYTNAFVDGRNTGEEEVHPVWWHFFNAHVLPNNDDGLNEYPRSQTLPSDATFLDPAAQNSIPLVMANPAYEGLGYLNFVVEYKYKDKAVGEDYTEFIDSSPALTVTSYHTADTYRAINDCSEADGQECSGYGEFNDAWNGVHGFYYYDLYMGSWLIAKSEDNGHLKKWTVYPFDGSGSVTDWDGTITSWSRDLFDSVNNAITTWSSNVDLVVSSFPHNNLGKDFRFNLRVLMGTVLTGQAAGTSSSTSAFRALTKSNFYSYYFYKINTIKIVFPYSVAYALHHENRSTGQSAMASRIDGTNAITKGANIQWWDTLNQDLNHPAFLTGTNADSYTKRLDSSQNPANGNTYTIDTTGQDYQFMHRSAVDTNKNIIPPVDLGTHAPSNDEFHRIRGYIDPLAAFTNSPDWCDAGARGAAIALEATCGTDFYIQGLMNTYDERRGQRGTYQEIWVQLQYAIGQKGRDERSSPCHADNNDSRCTVTNANYFQSPWPYVHFMASEIVTIEAKCDTDYVNNPNTCEKITFGTGRPNDAAYGGK